MANTHSTDVERGSDQYWSITDASQTGLDITGDFTIEAWVNFESDVAWESIAGKRLDAGSQKGYMFYYTSGGGGALRLGISSDGSAETDQGVTWAPSLSTWYHVAVTFDVSAGTAKFYVDGAQQGSDSTGFPTSIFDSTAPFMIGSWHDGTSTNGNFDGKIDDVRVWDVIRTESEISDNKDSELVGSEDNLVGYWKFNNDGNDSACNSNDLTNNNSATFSESVGLIPKSTDLERSSSQYWSITDGSQTGLDITGDMTIEAWVRPESTPGGGSQYAIAAKNEAAGNQRAYNFEYSNISSVTGLRFQISSSGSNDATAVHQVTLTNGEWTHVAVSYDASAGDATFYINGVAVETDTGLFNSIFNSSAAFQIGSSNVASGLFDGAIDDVRIWNDIRTETEIANNIGSELTGSETNLQGYWKFNGDATDETSNNNDLTNNGSAEFIGDSGLGRKSTDLESGSSQYWSISDSDQTGLDLTGDFTFELWTKLESQPSTNTERAFISKWENSGNQRSYIFAYADNSGTKRFRLYLNTSGAEPNTVGSLNYTIDLDVWTHIACVYDASAGEAEIFVNASSVGTMTGLDTSVFNGTAPFHIGFEDNLGPSTHQDGKIDDVRVWNDMRTSSEISENFQSELTGSESNLQAYWKFNSDGSDETSNDNYLTSNNLPIFDRDAAFDTDNGHSIDLELSSSQYLSLTDADQTGLNLAGDFTFEAWVKPESLLDNHIVSKGDRGANDLQYHFWIDVNGKVALRVSDDGSNTDTHRILWESNSGAIVTGTWQHVAVTFDISAETAVCYVNGSSVTFNKTAGSTIGATLHSSADDFLVGAHENSGLTGYQDGLIDEVRVWSDIRSSSEISDNYESELTGSETNLVGYWKLNNNFADLTGNGNTLTNNNSATFVTNVPFAGGGGSTPVAAQFMSTNTKFW